MSNVHHVHQVKCEMDPVTKQSKVTELPQFVHHHIFFSGVAADISEAYVVLDKLVGAHGQQYDDFRSVDVELKHYVHADKSADEVIQLMSYKRNRTRESTVQCM